MGKRLLSKDYDEIVFETFKLPESDFFKYYSNIVEEHIPFNSDLYEELILSVNRWIVWYRSQHQEDYTFGGRTWDGDKLMNPDETSISLLSLFDIRRHIDKSFFDMQLEQIEILKVRNDIDKLVEANEKFKLQLHQFEKEPRKDNKISLDRKQKEPQTFECLFKDSNIAKKVKEIFEIKGYTVNGKWQGLSNDKSELLCAYYVLKNIIKPGLKVAPTVKIFYSEFGLPENHITDRMMTTEPFNDIRKEFESVFSNLLEPKKTK